MKRGPYRTRKKFDTRSYIEEMTMPVTECGCWIWMGAIWSRGYGQWSRGAADRKAHRQSYREYRGEIPAGLHVLHHCDIPLCVNPDHLFLGTHTDNMRDKIAKGRGNYPKKLPRPTRKWHTPKIYEFRISRLREAS